MLWDLLISLQQTISCGVFRRKPRDIPELNRAIQEIYAIPPHLLQPLMGSLSFRECIEKGGIYIYYIQYFPKKLSSF